MIRAASVRERGATPRSRTLAALTGRPSVLVDLVHTTTLDGLRLDGAYQPPPADAAHPLALDGVCLLHGTGGNFYGSTLLEAVAERLLTLGCAALRVNTRGHDPVSNAATARGGLRQGAAYEAVDDCRHDVA